MPVRKRLLIGTKQQLLVMDMLAGIFFLLLHLGEIRFLKKSFHLVLVRLVLYRVPKKYFFDLGTLGAGCCPYSCHDSLSQDF